MRYSVNIVANEKCVKSTKNDAFGCTAVAQESARKRFVFSQSRLDALPVPPHGSQRVYYYDLRESGLFVGCSANGRMAFGLLYKDKQTKRTERVPLGFYRRHQEADIEMDIREAREEAKIKRGEIAGGDNPAARGRARKTEMTLSQLLEKYMGEYAKPKLREKTIVGYESLIKRHLQTWDKYHSKLGEVSREDVEKLHEAISDLTRWQANRVIELLCAAYNRALEKKWWKTGTVNPASGIHANKEKPRREYLKTPELAVFFQALALEPNEDAKHFFLLDWVTGVRRKNLLEAEWSEFDPASATWTIPAAKSKADEDLYIPLHPVALWVLAQREKVRNGSRYVFPGYRGNPHLSEVKSMWKRIITRAGLTDCRPHDIRRSLGSHAAQRGASLLQVAAMLGNTEAAARRHYAHISELESKRQLHIDTVDFILDAGNVRQLLGLPETI
jgi:integrase